MSYLCWRKQNIDVMKNLVEQTSLWLQSEMCRSGNIIERTLAVISAFKKYITEEENLQNDEVDEAGRASCQCSYV